MTTAQGDVTLLKDPVARELLGSRQLARLAYTWRDGTPRVVPIWFHGTGETITFGTPPKAPKVKALHERPEVSVTIDDSSAWPYHALLVRGLASVEMLDDVSPEYAESASRYFGPEQGEAWVATLRGQPMARVAVTPTWVAVLDFETRFPSALTVA
jgi:general stress protein 26